MKYEIKPGFWRMRNGEKVNVDIFAGNDDFPWCDPCDQSVSWANSGRMYGWKSSEYDLIEPWEEKPVGLTFMEAALSGKPFRRPCWDTDIWITCDKSGLYSHGCVVKIDHDTLKATDYILKEEAPKMVRWYRPTLKWQHRADSFFGAPLCRNDIKVWETRVIPVGQDPNAEVFNPEQHEEQVK